MISGDTGGRVKEPKRADGQVGGGGDQTGKGGQGKGQADRQTSRWGAGRRANGNKRPASGRAAGGRRTGVLRAWDYRVITKNALVTP